MATDLSYSKTGLLLHCDGTNNSTTFTDNSKTPKTVTPSGNAKLTTTTKQIGSASAIFDGTNSFDGFTLFFSNACVGTLAVYGYGI